MVDAGDVMLWGTVGLTAGVLAGTLAPARRLLASLCTTFFGVGVGILGGWWGEALWASRPMAFFGAAVVSVLGVVAVVGVLQRWMCRGTGYDAGRLVSWRSRLADVWRPRP